VGGGAKWWTVARREWRVTFSSPLAFVLLGIWMLMSGYFYVALITATQSSDLAPLLENMLVLVLFLAPLLSMRLLAEERRSGSEELVLTAPISPAQWVVGKYVGVLSVWTVFVAVALLFPLATGRLGTVDWGVVASSYLGMWLFGAVCLAAGLFASALTDNQLVAALVGFVIVLLLYAASFFGSATSGWLGNLLQYLALPNQFNDFSVGLISVSPTVYYVSLAVGFLFLAVRAVDMRRWA
jgi:ABC-2 type transport system permease protein